MTPTRTFITGLVILVGICIAALLTGCGGSPELSAAKQCIENSQRTRLMRYSFEFENNGVFRFRSINETCLVRANNCEIECF